MSADDVLEDLADGEEENCCPEVKHWPLLTENSEHKDGLQDDKYEEEDEWCELVEHIEGDVSMVISVPNRSLELVCPSKRGIESNVASAYSECESGDKDEAKRFRGSIINELIADHSVQHEDPSRSDNSCEVYTSERLQRG